MKNISILLVTIISLSGCITSPLVPSNVGNGKFLQGYTGSQNLLYQINFPTSLDCEIQVKNNYYEVTKVNIAEKCSNDDMAGLLLFKFVVEYSNQKFPSFFLTKDFCELALKELSKFPSNTILGSC